MFIMSPCTAETDLDCHRELLYSIVDLPCICSYPTLIFCASIEVYSIAATMLLLLSNKVS